MLEPDLQFGDRLGIDTGVATDARVISNQLGILAAQYTPVYTVRHIAKDCDVVIDCVTPPAAPNYEFGLYFCMTDVPSASFDGYAVLLCQRYVDSSSLCKWRKCWEYHNGSRYTFGGRFNMGVKGGITALKLYKKASGGNYQLILQATNAVHNLPGKIILEMSDTTQRWENLRGGPFIPATKSVMVV